LLSNRSIRTISKLKSSSSSLNSVIFLAMFMSSLNVSIALSGFSSFAIILILQSSP
jgi:hypothetical protein